MPPSRRSTAQNAWQYSVRLVGPVLPPRSDEWRDTERLDALSGVMENDADGVTLTGPNAADAMAQLYAVNALGALDRAAVDGEYDGIALLQRNHFDAALHPRALLGHHELAAGKVRARLRQQDGELQWEREFAVQILTQAIEVAGRILQQQRGRAELTGFVAQLEVIACCG